MSDGASGPLTVLMTPDPAAVDGNPYLTLLVEALDGRDVSVVGLTRGRVLHGAGDVVHVHWPEFRLSVRTPGRAAVRMSRLLTTLLIARLRHMPVLWTAHNLRGHERPHPRLERVFWWCFPRLLTGWLSLSAAGVEEVQRSLPALRSTAWWVTPHGHYRDAYPPPPAGPIARASLDLGSADVVLAHVGHLRAYKNAPALVRAFRDCGRASVLLVAGACHPPAVGDDVREAADGDARVRLDLVRATEEKMMAILSAADLVVLPYQETFNSGTALLALTADCPVLLPRTPVYEELQADVGAGWVHLYDGEISGETLDRAVGELPVEPSTPALGSRYDWPGIAELTEDAYRQALAASGRRRRS